MIHLWDVSKAMPEAVAEILSGATLQTMFGVTFGTTPKAALLALTDVCRFLPVSCAAYGLCWFLARLATSAASRFTVWLLYIVSMAVYWLIGLAQLFRALQSVMAVPGAALHGGPVHGSHPVPPMLSLTLPGTLASAIAGYLPPVCAAYLSLLAGLVLLGILRRRQLARALRFRLSPSPAVEQMFHALTDELGIANCSLWLMPGIATPAAIYWLHPAVCLPIGCTEATPDLENILRHELCHVRRRDNLWEAVARLCCGLLFFHPLLRRAVISLRLEREVACDAEVVRSHPDTRDRYADTLVRFGWIAVQSRFANAKFPDVRFAAHAGILNARVRSILAGKPLYSRRSQRGRTLGSVVVMWVFAATMPACWIGIDLRQSALPTQGIAAISTPRLYRPHHALRIAAHTITIQPAAPHTPRHTAAVAGSEPLLPSLSPATLPQVQYQSVHDELQLAQVQPTVSPADPDESSGSTVSQQVPGKGRAKLSPSTVSVIVGAAIFLGHLGLDHDHDRD